MVRGYCISSSVGGETGEVLPYVSLTQPNCLFYIISGGEKYVLPCTRQPVNHISLSRHQN